MKILILGAGRAGSSVAGYLASESNDIVVVDRNPDVLRALRDRIDIATVVGNAAHPPVLERAGAAHADMIVAVTDRDETNLLACQIVHRLFRTPKKIARVRASEFLSRADLFTEGGIAVDVVISPEQIVMEFIKHLIEYPGAVHVSDFANGKVRLVGVRVRSRGLLVGKQIAELSHDLPEMRMRVAAIFRQGRAVVPNGRAVIKEGDEVFFVAPREHIRSVMKELSKLDPPYKRLFFAGGGHVGKRLALALEGDYDVKIIEHNPARVKKIASELKHTIVLHGDAADEELLHNENIDHSDLFCALTDDDGVNMLAARLAKRLGAGKVMAIFSRPIYAELCEGFDVDVTIVPDYITIGRLLKHVRRGDVVEVTELRGGTAEAIEAVAHGDKRTSKVVGRRVSEVEMPEGVVMGALVRRGEVLMVHHDTIFEEGDHVVMFLMGKELIPHVERIFQAA